MKGKIVEVDDYHEFDYIAEVMGYKTSKELGFCTSSKRPFVGVVGTLTKTELVEALKKHKKCCLDDNTDDWCDIREKFYPETMPKKVRV